MNALLTVKQVAEVLAVSTSLVYDLAARGLIKHHRLAGRGRGTLRFAQEHVQAYLDSTLQEAGVTPPSPSAAASSGSQASPFSDLDPDRLRRAWEEG
jgi:excisionase family DNA binding protein